MSNILRIEIRDPENPVRKGTSEKTGKDYKIRSQPAFFHNGDHYPFPADLQLGEDQKAFEPGLYTLGAKSFRRGKYGLELARELDLVPLNERPSAPAPAAKQG